MAESHIVFELSAKSFGVYELRPDNIVDTKGVVTFKSDNEKDQKDQITTLLNDTKYLEWCKQQEWFQKFPIVYNICVNQTITSSNQNSKTPEHNKLQNLFLDNENVEKLLKIIFKKTSKNL